nr:MAG TPA: Histone deacetylation protein Rxt3 [Caudoviricetes sp.]
MIIYTDASRILCKVLHQGYSLREYPFRAL